MAKKYVRWVIPEDDGIVETKKIIECIVNNFKLFIGFEPSILSEFCMFYNLY